MLCCTAVLGVPCAVPDTSGCVPLCDCVQAVVRYSWWNTINRTVLLVLCVQQLTHHDAQNCPMHVFGHSAGAVFNISHGSLCHSWLCEVHFLHDCTSLRAHQFEEGFCETLGCFKPLLGNPIRLFPKGPALGKLCQGDQQVPYY
jgi:hypothetical protein